MSERAVNRMTADAFLLWHEQQQDRRYELVDGVPVAVAGARRRHDQVVVNTLVALGGQLASGSCRPFTSDTAVRISEFRSAIRTSGSIAVNLLTKTWRHPRLGSFSKFCPSQRVPSTSCGKSRNTNRFPACATLSWWTRVSQKSSTGNARTAARGRFKPSRDLSPRLK